jgi:hypothetical protein
VNLISSKFDILEHDCKSLWKCSQAKSKHAATLSTKPPNPARILFHLDYDPSYAQWNLNGASQDNLGLGGVEGCILLPTKDSRENTFKLRFGWATNNRA